MLCLHFTATSGENLIWDDLPYLHASIFEQNEGPATDGTHLGTCRAHPFPFFLGRYLPPPLSSSAGLAFLHALVYCNSELQTSKVHRKVLDHPKKDFC